MKKGEKKNNLQNLRLERIFVYDKRQNGISKIHVLKKLIRIFFNQMDFLPLNLFKQPVHAGRPHPKYKLQ